jgi:hypothetical protein
MAWNVDQIFSFVQFLTRKNQSNSISANEFFLAWNGQGSAYLQDMLGRFQKASNTKEGITTGAIENQTIMTKLAPFTKNVTIPVVAGQATKPGDFTYTWAIMETTSQQRVWPVNKDQIYSVLEDVIDPPSIEQNNYYCTEYLGYFQLYPSATGSIDLDYCSSPIDIVWGSTPDANNRPVYDAATSVQPLWSQASIIEITSRTLDYFGVSYKDQDFSQFGNKVLAKGE